MRDYELALCVYDPHVCNVNIRLSHQLNVKKIYYFNFIIYSVY